MTSAQRLALLGGEPVLERQLTRFNTYDNSEVEAAKEVVESGLLSGFMGSNGPAFYGGPRVKEFEKEWAKIFGVKNAITINSWSSGLTAALGAVGLEPGDEVITSTWTMCATATAILQWNGIPVFADIDPDTYCICPDSIRANITEHTRAIVTVDIFGQSSNMTEISKIAAEHNLKVICDTAQAPMSTHNGIYSGTLGDIGGYSLNYHKHIHTGEGGVIVTNDDDLAERVRLIRNHAEAVVGGMKRDDLRNMIGANYRLGEIESAIGLVQLRKLKGIIMQRQHAARILHDGLRDLEGLELPKLGIGNTSVYYMFPIRIDVSELRVKRKTICDALRAEGLGGIQEGYANIHLLPMYQQKIGYGSAGFPWKSDICKREVDYRKGICPTAERYHEETYIGFACCLYRLSDSDCQAVIDVFRKVWRSMPSLRGEI